MAPLTPPAPKAEATSTQFFTLADCDDDGEFKLDMFSKEGHGGSLIFQCAEINKPLCSVSHLTDNEYLVVFNIHEGNDVSYILHKPTKRLMKLRRERGVYVLDAWTEADLAPVETTGFNRPS